MTTTTTQEPPVQATTAAQPVANQALIVPPPAPPAIAPGYGDASLLNEAAGGRFWTNLDMRNDTDLALATRCRGDEARKFDKHLNQVIKLRAVYIHDTPPQLDEASGELTMFRRIVLIDDDGEIYECCSSGVLDSLRVLWAAKGPGPWGPPLPVKFVQTSFTRKTDGQQGRIFKLVYCPEPKPAQQTQSSRRQRS